MLLCVFFVFLYLSKYCIQHSVSFIYLFILFWVSLQTQYVKELSGSKRPGRLDFMDEDEGTPLKKLRDSTLTDAYNNQERSAVAAEQHRRKQ